MPKIEIWGDGSGGSSAVTLNYVAGEEIDVVTDVEAHLFFTLSGTDPTTLDIRLEVSFDDGSSWEILETPIDAVLGSLATEYFAMVVPDRSKIRLSLKRTGGAADTAAYVEIVLRQTSGGSLPGGQSQSSLEAADFDGASLPAGGLVEGDIVTPKGSLTGIAYVMPVNEDGSATPLAPEGTAAGEGLQVSLDDGTNTVFAQGDTTGNARIVGSVAHDAVDSGDPVLSGLHARSTLPAVVAEGDRVRAIGDLYGRTRTYDASHDPLTATNTTTVANGPETQWLNEEIVDVTNGTDGTYYYYIDMGDYAALGLQMTLSGGSGSVTVTVEGTIQPDLAAPSCTYHDITNTLYGVANWTANAIALDTGRVAGECRFVRIKVIAATGGANDGDWKVDSKKVY
jgi:hypothetical protein